MHTVQITALVCNRAVADISESLIDEKAGVNIRIGELKTFHIDVLGTIKCPKTFAYHHVLAIQQALDRRNHPLKITYVYPSHGS